MLRYLSTAAAMLMIAGVSHAQAAAPTTDGFAACSVIFPSKMRLIYTSPLPATPSQTADMAKAFAADLQRRVYTAEPTIEMLGDCHWEPTSEKAEAYMNTIKRNVGAKGMTTFGMSYTPTVTN